MVPKIQPVPFTDGPTDGLSAGAAPAGPSPDGHEPRSRRVSNGDGTFECNVCLEQASDPVVTVCGHLYCWRCIYTWLKTSAEPSCPICKADLSSRDRMIPLYGRGQPERDPRLRRMISAEEGSPATVDEGQASPASRRPSGQRPMAAPAVRQLRRRREEMRSTGRDADEWDGHPGQNELAEEIGSLGFAWPWLRSNTASPGDSQRASPAAGYGGGAGGIGRDLRCLSPLEQAREEKLSRLLLLLGSFVCLALLMF